MTARTALRRQPDAFDTTNPVVGSAIGVDIYVVPRSWCGAPWASFSVSLVCWRRDSNC
jgi:hypothetical protein